MNIILDRIKTHLMAPTKGIVFLFEPTFLRTENMILAEVIECAPVLAIPSNHRN
jgi:hypothetical protein